MKEGSLHFSHDQIRDIVAQKAWYGLDPQTGAFDWQASLNKLANQFSLSADTLGPLITDCFTSDCLSRVKLEKNDQQTTVPLIQAISDLNIPFIVWTVGDCNWQKTKIQRTQTDQYIKKEDGYVCASANKLEMLKTVLTKISQNMPSENKIKVIVVDDKAEILTKLMEEVAPVFSRQNIAIGNYHMKLNDPQADANAFYRWLQDQLQDNPSLYLVLDFDGVIADTNSVLFGPVVEKIFAALNSNKV